MDYSKMSDFEVNSAVFEALHGGAPDYKEGDSGAMVLISYEGDIVDGDAVEVEVERGAFNPCNSPADAWPIIQENLLRVVPVSFLGKVSWVVSRDIHSNHDTNPLRAAMITFLMMQDSANVQADSTR